MPVVGSFGYILYVLLALIGGIAGIAGIPNLTLTGFDILTIGTIISPSWPCQGALSTPLARYPCSLIWWSWLWPAPPESLTWWTKNWRRWGYVGHHRVIEENGRLVECEECSNHWAWKKVSEAGATWFLWRGISAKDVDFGYDEEKIVLHNINLYAKPGHKIAFVGSTGAGKTTITNLINQFWYLREQHHLWWHRHKPNQKRWLEKIPRVVLQDVNLFTGTVMDNIRYGKLDATDEECIQAAKMANADGYQNAAPGLRNRPWRGRIRAFSRPGQLLSIARAAVANPPVMILDEATSSIDTRTEAIVQKGMDALMKGRTVFVIAHRLSTIQNANAIMLLDPGKNHRAKVPTSSS